jgi:hypothetical protein
VPTAGWDDEGFEGVVDGKLALGYATPADPDDGPPARVVETRPPTDDESLSAETLVREFGPGTPPLGAVGPDPPGAGDDDTGTETRIETEQRRPDEPPSAVAGWLDEVERRLEDAEQLAAATSLEDATDAVAEVGGAGEVQSLGDQMVEDHKRLRTVARHCEALADRAEAVEVPVETLAQLA